LEDAEVRILHAGDDKFSGVYDLLSLELPEQEATELREFLSERAMDRGDHRLSDRYLEGLRARRSLERKDPDWLIHYDRQDVAADNHSVAEWDIERSRIIEKLSGALSRVDAGRGGTRIVSASRSDTLLAATRALLEEAGITSAGVGDGQRPLFLSADGLKFGVVGLAHYASIPRRLVDAAQTTITLLPDDAEPTLVIVNAEADKPPPDRSGDGMTAVRESLRGPRLAFCSALDLLVRIRSPTEGPQCRLAELWNVPRTLSPAGVAPS
jgi:hypothetical protein